MPHDWFSNLTGFGEESYELTRSRLVVAGDELVSTVNGNRYGIGTLEVLTLAELRSRVGFPHAERSTVRCVTGEARSMHADPELEGAVFQVASQFNLLEMTGPSVTPEDGVTRYSSDHTQGPACAVAAGAATIYRNYFAPVDGEYGQTRNRQIDGLAAVGTALSTKLGRPVADLWTMRNGRAVHRGGARCDHTPDRRGNGRGAQPIAWRARNRLTPACAGDRCAQWAASPCLTSVLLRAAGRVRQRYAFGVGGVRPPCLGGDV